MGNTGHFPGHRVEEISFRRGWVRCGCGMEFTVTIDPFALYVGHEALAAVFWAHRKEEAVRVGLKL
jgi:hypothetical protein